MAFLAAAAPYIALAGSAVSAIKQKEAGDAAELDAQRVAAQETRNGIASQAESQRQAINERHRAEVIGSRARAIGASQGGSVSDPSMQKILGDISSEGEYRALSALYSGDSDAASARAQSAATVNQGRAAKRSAYLNAGSTILSGASDFYSKYNPKKAA